MLVKPVSIWPCVLCALLAVFCAGMWAGIVPAPGWCVVLGLYLAFTFGLFTVATATRWIIDGAVRTSCLRDSLNPEARMAEAIGRMNDKQLLVLSYALTGEPDALEPSKDPGLIRLSNGETVEAHAIERIANNLEGDELRAERSYQVDRQPIRATHDTLTDAGIITPAAGNQPPRIADRKTFEQIVSLAQKHRQEAKA